jgi:hypothetical protein
MSAAHAEPPAEPEVARDLGPERQRLEVAAQRLDVDPRLRRVAHQRVGVEPLLAEQAVVEAPELALRLRAAGRHGGGQRVRVHVERERLVGHPHRAGIAHPQLLEDLVAGLAVRALEVAEHHHGDRRIGRAAGGRVGERHVEPLDLHRPGSVALALARGGERGQRERVLDAGIALALAALGGHRARTARAPEPQRHDEQGKREQHGRATTHRCRRLYAHRRARATPRGTFFAAHASQPERWASRARKAAPWIRSSAVKSVTRTMASATP